MSHNEIDRSFFWKISAILTRGQNRSTVVIVLLMILAAVLEMLSIGLIIPLIGIMVDPQLYSSLLTDFLHIENIDEYDYALLTMLGMSFLTLIYIIKAVYLSFVAFYQSKYIYDIQQSISNRLLVKYIHAPHAFHLQRNPSELVNNIVNETNLFSISVTVPLNIIFSEIFVVFSLLVLLFFYEPIGGGIVVVFLIGSALLFYNYTKKRLQAWGKMRQYSDEQRLKSLQEILHGMKEIKILGKESWFADVFKQHNQESTRIQALQRSFLQMPRFIIEVLAVVSLLLLLIFLGYQGKSTDEMVVVVGLFAAIAFRVAPSANKVLVSFQEMRYASSIVNKLYDELLLEEAPCNVINERASVSFLNSLVFSGVSVSYPNSENLILSDIDLNIKPGEFVGIIGESGSGKTTLLNLLLGMLPPKDGSIFVDATDLYDDIQGWQSLIGYVPQAVYLIDDTISNNIALGVPPDEIDEFMLGEAVIKSELSSVIDDLDDGLDSLVGERGSRLSGGQIQRVGVARALYNNPSVLILDEATSSLDEMTESFILRTISKLKGKMTIIFVTHKKSSISLCDSVYEVRNGLVKKLEGK